MCSPLWTLLLLATCLCPQTLRALKESYRRGHDGSTVDEMLARLGEGPALFTDAGATSTCEDSTCEVYNVSYFTYLSLTVDPSNLGQKTML